MAVQKSRKTRSKVRMRRSHDRVAVPALSVDKTTGEKHIRHHITADGFYRGKLVVIKPLKAPVSEETTENS